MEIDTNFRESKPKDVNFIEWDHIINHLENLLAYKEFFTDGNGYYEISEGKKTIMDNVTDRKEGEWFITNFHINKDFALGIHSQNFHGCKIFDDNASQNQNSNLDEDSEFGARTKLNSIYLKPKPKGFETKTEDMSRSIKDDSAVNCAQKKVNQNDNEEFKINLNLKDNQNFTKSNELRMNGQEEDERLPTKNSNEQLVMSYEKVKSNENKLEMLEMTDRGNYLGVVVGETDLNSSNTRNCDFESIKYSHSQEE